MTNIVGTITNSAGTPVSGVLTAALTRTVIDDSTDPDTVRTIKPELFTITSGALDIELPESATYQTTYRFVFVEDGETDALFDFFKIVPNVGTVQFSSFLPTGISDRNLDTSAERVSRLLATDDTLSQLVKQPAVFSESINGETTAVKFYLPKPFDDAILIRSLTVLGISGYEDWDFDLGVLNSSGNEEVLGVSTTTTATENGRRRIHQRYDIYRAASVMGLYMEATPQAGAGSLTATLSVSYTEV